MRPMAAVCFFVLTGCGGSQKMQGPPPVVEDPALLTSTDDIAKHFVVQQRVRARFGDREIVFHATIQNTERGLVLIAFSPQGQKAFVLQQKGKAVTWENHLGRKLPFSPWRILLAIHRTYFRGSRVPLPDGKHVVDHAKERVRETWQSGRLRERTFENKSTHNRITIRYGGESRELFESSATYHNETFDYTLEVVPVRFSILSDTPKDE